MTVDISYTDPAANSCQTIWNYQSAEERFGEDGEIWDAREECPHGHKRQLERKHVWNRNREVIRQETGLWRQC